MYQKSSRLPHISCFLATLAALQGYLVSVWNLVAVCLVSSLLYLTRHLLTPALMLIAKHPSHANHPLETPECMQIVLLVFYLPLLSAFFDEPPHWSVCFQPFVCLQPVNVSMVHSSQHSVCSCPCSNYLQAKQGSLRNTTGVPAHQLTTGWQIFPVLTNYFFLVCHLCCCCCLAACMTVAVCMLSADELTARQHCSDVLTHMLGWILHPNITPTTPPQAICQAVRQCKPYCFVPEIMIPMVCSACRSIYVCNP